MRITDIGQGCLCHLAPGDASPGVFFVPLQIITEEEIIHAILAHICQGEGATSLGVWACFSGEYDLLMRRIFGKYFALRRVLLENIVHLGDVFGKFLRAIMKI